MSIELPAEFNELTAGAYATAEEALAPGEIDDLHENLHYMWTQEAAQAGGHIFDPPAEFTGVTFTDTPDNSGTVGKLSDRRPGAVYRRVDANGDIRCTIEVAGEHIQVEGELMRLDDDLTTHSLGTDTIQITSPSGWDVIEVAPAEADTTDDAAGTDPAPLFWKLTARVDTDGNTGKFYQYDPVELGEGATVSDIP